MLPKWYHKLVFIIVIALSILIGVYANKFFSPLACPMRICKASVSPDYIDFWLTWGYKIIILAVVPVVVGIGIPLWGIFIKQLSKKN